MAYTPPSGRAVALAFRVAYQPVAGRRVAIRFGNPEVPPPDPEPVVIGHLTAPFHVPWSRPAEVRTAIGAGWGTLAVQLAVRRVVWGGREARSRAVDVGWRVSPQVVRAAAVAWRGQAHGVQRGLSAPWRALPVHAASVAIGWHGTRPSVAAGLHAAWRHPPKHARGASLRWAASEARHAAVRRVAWRSPPEVVQLWRIPWGMGQGLQWIVRPQLPPPPPVPVYPRDGRKVRLDFQCRVYRHPSNRIPIRFGAPACYAARPRERAYVVLNEFTVVRLPDRLPIHVDSVSIAGGRDAAYWEVAMSLADPSQLEALAPTVAGPRSVELTVNGYPWVVAIEGFDESRVHGASEVSVRGRSVTARLADPYAAPRTREITQARTMLQLAADELDGTGIGVDYGTVSWLVPAGAWYYDGMTPMAALVRLAEASGGVVQSHRTEPTVLIRPRYPVSPWHWTTTAPDVVIQDDIVTGTRLQLQSRPLFDAVIVAGERVGVAAKVKREGEAGQAFAPQQVDQLITHADGARERGRNVLSDRGGQALIEHDLPLFGGTLQPGQPGLVLPLMLAQRRTGEGTWHGLVVGVRIEARRQGAEIDIVQTVTLERHYTDAD